MNGSEYIYKYKDILKLIGTEEKDVEEGYRIERMGEDEITLERSILLLKNSIILIKREDNDLIINIHTLDDITKVNMKYDVRDSWGDEKKYSINEYTIYWKDFSYTIEKPIKREGQGDFTKEYESFIKRLNDKIGK